MPSVKLECGHIFHAECLRTLLRHRWNTVRISFAFMDCPCCKQPIKADHCPQIKKELVTLEKLRTFVQLSALMTAARD